MGAHIRQAPKYGRISITPTKQLRGYVLQLLDTGLYGKTMAECVERLLCEGIQRRMEPLKLRIPEKD